MSQFTPISPMNLMIIKINIFLAKLFVKLIHIIILLFNQSITISLKATIELYWHENLKLQFRLIFNFSPQKINYISYEQLYFNHLKKRILKFLVFKVFNHLQCST
jgi:hypothetical protein